MLFDNGSIQTTRLTPISMFRLKSTPGAARVVIQDPTLSPTQKTILMESIAAADQMTGFPKAFTTGDLAKGLIYAGLGAGAANISARAAGAVFGLPKKYRGPATAAGALGGVLRATGVWE